MTIGAATLFVALAIAPGVALLFAAATALKVSRNIGSGTVTLILATAAAAAAHLGAALVAWILWSVATAPGLDPGGGGIGRMQGSIADLLRGDPLTIAATVNLLLYTAFAVVVGGVTGWPAGWAVYTHRLPVPFFHGAYYRFTGTTDGVVQIVYASVLTRTEIGGMRLLYEGVLVEFTRDGDGSVSSLVLLAPYRSLMAVAGSAQEGCVPAAEPSVLQVARSDIGDETQDPDNALFVSGAEIANIVLATQRVDTGSV